MGLTMKEIKGKEIKGVKQESLGCLIALQRVGTGAGLGEIAQAMGNYETTEEFIKRSIREHEVFAQNSEVV